MKKFLLILLVFITTNILAQDNNPYNEIGISFNQSCTQFLEDFDNRKISDITQETINTYLPNSEVSLENALEVYKKLNTKGFNYKEAINNSENLSEQNKEILLDLLNKLKISSSVDELKEYLINKVELIKGQEMQEEQKKFLLSTISICYNLSTNQSILSRGNNPCSAQVDDGQQQVSGPVNCIFVCTVLGAYYGYQMCGLHCAGVGAGIGLLVGIGLSLS